MTTNIIKPTATTNYTTLPNQLLGYGRHIQGLKPRDSSVLNYLLSKPPHWRVIAKDIAIAVNISINTVYRALTVLQKLGIVSYTRDRFGYCRWLVSVSDTLYKPVTVPHPQKPHEHFDDVLTNTDRTVIKEKTTTVVEGSSELIAVTAPPVIDYVNAPTVTTKVEPVNLVIEPITTEKQLVEPVTTLDLPEQLTEIEKLTAVKSLTKANLDAITYTVVLMALKSALTTGVVRSPLAYLHGLLNKAKDGSLDTRKFTETKTTVSRSSLIKSVIDKHGDKILLDLVTNGAIQVKELGLVQYSEVKELGLVSSSWIKRYNDIQLAKMAKLSATKPVITSTKQLATKPVMNEMEFEAKRQAQIELAMAMLDK